MSCKNDKTWILCDDQICVCPEEFYGGKYSQGWEAMGWMVNIGCQCHGKCALSPPPSSPDLEDPRKSGGVEEKGWF